MEKIKSAAIRKEGKIYSGKNHAECLKQAPYFGALKSGEQGFLTTNNRFVGREEAAKIALCVGQIKKLKFSKTELFSEDLYSED